MTPAASTSIPVSASSASSIQAEIDQIRASYTRSNSVEMRDPEVDDTNAAAAAAAAAASSLLAFPPLVVDPLSSDTNISSTPPELVSETESSDYLSSLDDTQLALSQRHVARKKRRLGFSVYVDPNDHPDNHVVRHLTTLTCSPTISSGSGGVIRDKSRRLAQLLGDHPLFRSLSPEIRRRTFSEFILETKLPDAILFTQGLASDMFYVIDEGEILCTYKAEQSDGKERQVLKTVGDTLGDLALMQPCPQAQVCTARVTSSSSSSHAVVYSIDGCIFRFLIQNGMQLRYAQLKAFFTSLPLFDANPHYSRDPYAKNELIENLIENAEILEFHQGDVIVPAATLMAPSVHVPSSSSAFTTASTATSSRTASTSFDMPPFLSISPSSTASSTACNSIPSSTKSPLRSLSLSSPTSSSASFSFPSSSATATSSSSFPTAPSSTTAPAVSPSSAYLQQQQQQPYLRTSVFIIQEGQISVYHREKVKQLQQQREQQQQQQGEGGTDMEIVTLSNDGNTAESTSSSPTTFTSSTSPSPSPLSTSTTSSSTFPTSLSDPHHILLSSHGMFGLEILSCPHRLLEREAPSPSPMMSYTSYTSSSSNTGSRSHRDSGSSSGPSTPSLAPMMLSTLNPSATASSSSSSSTPALSSPTTALSSPKSSRKTSLGKRGSGTLYSTTTLTSSAIAAMSSHQQQQQPSATSQQSSAFTSTTAITNDLSPPYRELTPSISIRAVRRGNISSSGGASSSPLHFSESPNSATSYSATSFASSSSPPSSSGITYSSSLNILGTSPDARRKLLRKRVSDGDESLLLNDTRRALLFNNSQFMPVPVSAATAPGSSVTGQSANSRSPSLNAATSSSPCASPINLGPSPSPSLSLSNMHQYPVLSFSAPGSIDLTCGPIPMMAAASSSLPAAASSSSLSSPPSTTSLTSYLGASSSSHHIRRDTGTGMTACLPNHCDCRGEVRCQSSSAIVIAIDAKIWKNILLKSI